MAMKPNGKSPVTSDHDEKIMLFRDVTPGPHETQLRFRLIHFWEAWNPLKKTLIGLEMLLIDEQRSVIQGFIPPSHIERHLSKMKPGSLYKLNNFYGSSNKTMYRVSDHAVTVSFSWNSELSVLEDSPTPFDEDRFRFHSFEEFQAGCDRKGDLVLSGHEIVECYCVVFLLTRLMNNGIDVVGHMKVVNGQCLIGTPVLDEVEIARARHVLVHVQSYELGSKPQSAELVNAEVVTKRETLTIGEIFSYIKQGSNKANGDQGVTQEVPFPEALISTIGQKHNFCVKVTKHNLDGKSRSLTVTKILPLDTPPVTESSGENYNPETSEETFETGTNVCEASKISVDSAEGKTNKTEPPSTMDHHHESYSTRDETLCFQRPSPQTVYVMYQVREVWNVSKAGPPRLTTTGSDLYRVSREPLEKQGMSTNHHHQP
uniref:DUF223 domain-containing protein n=2 Tax=Brassica campestris TaxID=3711 RepID=M4D1D6_BRACM